MKNTVKKPLVLFICAAILLSVLPAAASAANAAGQTPRFGSVSPGDVITFGNYHGATEWLVLAVKPNRMLVISRQGIDCRRYNETSKAVTWETCSLRRWLNSTFIDEAFSKEEQALICMTKVINSRATQYGSDGNDTVDRVYLLNMKETDTYFSSAGERKTAASAYAKENGAKTTAKGECTWWLRSRGDIRNKAAYVSTDGKRGYLFVSNGSCCVRPVMWLSLAGNNDPQPPKEETSGVPTSGRSGDTTWRWEGNTLYIEGAGRMADYTLEGDEENGWHSTAPWFPYTMHSDDIRLQISNDVTYIGDCAFYGFWSNFTSWDGEPFRLPDKLTAVGDYAFCGAGHIRDLMLPKGVVSVGKCAFMNWVDGSVTVPAATVEIGEGAFAGGEWRTDVKVDPNNKAYRSVDGALFSKDMTTLYCYPEIAAEAISDGSYSYEEDVYAVPDSVTEIAPYAFYKSFNEGPSRIILPKYLTAIGEYAFSGLAGSVMITSLTIPDGVAIIRSHTFYGSSLQEIFLPDGLREIEDSAFAYSDLEKVLFAGTEEQWRQIRIGENNENLLTAEIVFGAGRP